MPPQDWEAIDKLAEARKLTRSALIRMGMAEDMYMARERSTKSNPNILVVLVSAGDLKAIQRAYPNYFLDTSAFLQHLEL